MHTYFGFILCYTWVRKRFRTQLAAECCAGDSRPVIGDKLRLAANTFDWQSELSPLLDVLKQLISYSLSMHGACRSGDQ